MTVRTKTLPWRVETRTGSSGWRAAGVRRRRPDRSETRMGGRSRHRVEPSRFGGVAWSAQRRVVVLLGLFAVGVFVGMAQVWVRLRIVRLGYELSTETNRTARLERLVRKLSVERAMLRNPQRIRKIATERFGLRPPKPEEITEIRVGGPAPFGLAGWQVARRGEGGRGDVGGRGAGGKSGRGGPSQQP